jgi:hypothetical protein
MLQWPLLCDCARALDCCRTPQVTESLTVAFFYDSYAEVLNPGTVLGGHGFGAVCDQKTSKFFVSRGKNPWQDTWV